MIADILNLVISSNVFYTAHPQVEVKDNLPQNENKESGSNFGTETHNLGQTIENQNMIIKERMSKLITTKLPINNVNSDSMTFPPQQKDCSNKNYITSRERDIYRAADSEVTPSTPDVLCES